MHPSDLPAFLTHYYRPFTRPFLSLSELSDPEVAALLAALVQQEPLPYRLTQVAYLPERRRIEARLRARFVEKGGRPERLHPHYLVLGSFSLWEQDDHERVRVPLASVCPDQLSFTLTDSFFNFRDTNLRGAAIPSRGYRRNVYTLAELPGELDAHDLPTEAWRSDPTRRFEVYVEAQLWSDEPIRGWLDAGGPAAGGDAAP